MGSVDRGRGSSIVDVVGAAYLPKMSLTQLLKILIPQYPAPEGRRRRSGVERRLYTSPTIYI